MQITNEIVINVQEIEPKLRHLTIFQTFDRLALGESLLIHNNHDPKPVYHQLYERRGDSFTWEYLREGPECWDIRVTKTADFTPGIYMTQEDEIVVSVPEIEPQFKHQTIFSVFEDLKPGESMIIHNNHDPKPVYFQLQNTHGDTFSWDYLQEGPDWWDIRVRKAAVEVQSIYENADGDIYIDVPTIEPQRKHPSIFEVFDELKKGKSLIIHNDHDPKPVFYELQGERGDVFSWEYLLQGPDFWDVRITKNVEPSEIQNKRINQNGATSAAKSTKEAIVVDVPSIEPKFKHPRIFEVFDQLEKGESLIIHNDHDPKPVYYQLLGERGDVFVWEYLMQGPEFWDVRVTKRGVGESETVGQITAKDLRKAEVFKKYGIDFSCGGKKTVREACKEKGIDATKVEQELQQPIQSITENHTNYNEWSLDFLTDYIINIHHNYAKKYLPEIQGYANKVAQVHNQQHPELFQLRDTVQQLNDQFSAYLLREEQDSLVFVKKILQAHNHKLSYSSQESQQFIAMLEQTELQHTEFDTLVKEIRRLSNDFALPEDACTSYEVLFKMLQEFETDLQLHLHLKNNILFPRTKELEKELLS